MEAWEEVEMAVDSGASTTVIDDETLPGIPAEGANPDIHYEIADGIKIPHMGTKTFTAHMENGEVRKLTATVTEVNKCLLSVSKIAAAGSRVVFDVEGSYIESSPKHPRIPLEAKRRMKVLMMWVAKDQKRPF